MMMENLFESMMTANMNESGFLVLSCTSPSSFFHRFFILQKYFRVFEQPKKKLICLDLPWQMAEISKPTTTLDLEKKISKIFKRFIQTRFTFCSLIVAFTLTLEWNKFSNVEFFIIHCQSTNSSLFQHLRDSKIFWLGKIAIIKVWVVESRRLDCTQKREEKSKKIPKIRGISSNPP